MNYPWDVDTLGGLPESYRTLDAALDALRGLGVSRMVKAGDYGRYRGSHVEVVTIRAPGVVGVRWVGARKAADRPITEALVRDIEFRGLLRDKAPETLRLVVSGKGAGDVHISLRDGESLTWGYGETTEEGYHSESYTWERDGGTIYCHHWTSGRDCDGGYGTDRALSCPHYRLKAWDVGDGRPARPEWDFDENSNYDQYAQAAGY